MPTAAPGAVPYHHGVDPAPGGVAAGSEQDRDDDDQQNEAAEAEGESPVHDALSVSLYHANPSGRSCVPGIGFFDEGREPSGATFAVALSV
jgi:hypothetical protein